jgi:hypothetical protein
MNENDLKPAFTEEVPVPKEEYKPSRLEVLKDYEIRIRFLDRGCIVEVGCKSIAFETVDSAMLEINNYVANPYEAQQKWRKLFNM